MFKFSSVSERQPENVNKPKHQKSVFAFSLRISPLTCFYHTEISQEQFKLGSITVFHLSKKSSKPRNIKVGNAASSMTTASRLTG